MISLQYDENDPETISNPYPLYDQLRSHDPVHWSEANNFWLLTRYSDVASVIRDDRVSSDRFRAISSDLPAEAQEQFAPFINMVSAWMLMSDAPAHTRLRGLVNKAFTPRMIDNIRARIQELVDGMLDAVQDDGRFDLISALANPLPGIVIAEMLGVPAEDQPQFKKWSDDIAIGLTGNDTTGSRAERYLIGQKSFLELSDYFKPVVERLRSQPEDNLLSAMVQAEESGDTLSQEELFANCVLLMFAGQETTTNLIGNGILALLNFPDQMEMLRNDPSLMVSATEELLRYDSPVQKLGRLAIEDIEVDGKKIAKGDEIVFCYAAANRDPEEFQFPNQLDLSRTNNRHMAFAHGTHYCLGAALARLEGQISINAVVQRMPNLRLESDDLEWNPSAILRGLKSLPVSF